MPIISKKKVPYKISEGFHKYLKQFGRELKLPILYADLLRYNNAISLYDKDGKDTLWETVFYPQADMKEIYLSLKKIYALLKADGDLDVMDHLTIDRVDLCTYGNTRPLRIRVVNQLNDNFDYFYIKNADANRVYGLELEDLLSPNRVSYLVDQDTLIEEHIVGIPGEQFIRNNLYSPELNKIRLSKEFVKFNERCFVRLLGDMHSSNFVIDITPDFEEVSYRMRAIDFDQQSYEGRKSVYLPQYYTQNNPFIKLGFDILKAETIRQYQLEERSLISKRLKVARHRVLDLTGSMCNDELSQEHHVRLLKNELSDYYNDASFMKCKNMGEILRTSLYMLIKKPHLYK